MFKSVASLTSASKNTGVDSRSTALVFTAVVVIAIIGGAALLLGGSGQAPSGTSTTGSASTGGTVTSGLTTSTSPGLGMSSPQGGVLSVLFTDPPNMPPGASGLYLTVEGLQVEGPSGWVAMGGPQEVSAASGYSVTLASGAPPAGAYGALRFNVTSATVTFGGANLTSEVVGGELSSTIEGGVTVSGSAPSAVVVDFMPTVLNLGNDTRPEFVLIASSSAYAVPSGSITGEMQSTGAESQLSGLAWWQSDQASSDSRLQLSGAALSGGLLKLTVGNAGPANTTIRLVTVAPVDTAMGMSTPQAMGRSAVFLVLPNGSLVSFRPVLHAVSPYIVGEGGSASIGLLGSGYDLVAGSSVSLAYAGTISMGFGASSLLQVTAGSAYTITVISDNAAVSAQVVAA